MVLGIVAPIPEAMTTSENKTNMPVIGETVMRKDLRRMFLTIQIIIRSEVLVAKSTFLLKSKIFAPNGLNFKGSAKTVKSTIAIEAWLSLFRIFLFFIV